MNIDRRTILSLVAMGRITPREAERLLSVWPDEDEFILKLAVSAAIAGTVLPQIREFLGAFQHTATALLPDTFAAAHHALTCFTHWFGGIL
ncbi:MAG: hypothetical protein WBV28_03845 [Terracidiphilus sp.]